MDKTTASQSRTIKLHNNEKIPSLPEEIIIEEILPRLPVRSLLRFRCVAKSWRFSISSKKFMKVHLRNSIGFAHHRILFNTIVGFRHCSLPSLCNVRLTDSVASNVDFGIDIHKKTIYLVGCCNGLVCMLVDRNRFILWNPATKKFNILPDFGGEAAKGFISKSGFGFDELNDDYKVFGLRTAFDGNSQFTSKIYSLRNNLWEVVEGGQTRPFGAEGTYLSGKLHWSAHELGIYSFDLNTKVCGVIEVPRISQKSNIGVLKGCLSWFCYHHRTNGVDIWTMKEYGVKKSWYKMAIVPYYRIPNFESLHPTPLTICPNGEILLRYGNILVIYNPQSGAFRRPRIDNHDPFRDLGIYIESLVSVVPDAQQES